MVKCWVTRRDSQLLLQRLENLPHVLVICYLHVLKLCPCVHHPHQFFLCWWRSKIHPCLLEPVSWVFSCRLLDWILALVGPHGFPGARMTASLFIDILQIDWISQGLWFCHRWTFTGSRFLPSLTWHFASWLDQTENSWNGCKRTSRNSKRWTNEEDGSIRHVWNSLWSACQRVGFWVSRNSTSIFGSKLILSNNQQIKRKLDICQLWSFWSQLRCLQRCTPEDSPWEECVFVGT